MSLSKPQSIRQQNGGSALMGALDRMNRELEDYERRHGEQPSEQARSTIVIRACIASGASQQIAYGEPGQEKDLHPAPVVRESRKVGRNDPCPCGSGKKYKNCCGRVA